VRGNSRTTAGFDYAGPLTEAVLLGGVASQFPNNTLDWDAKALAVKNVKEANIGPRSSASARSHSQSCASVPKPGDPESFTA
jgi:hypothetical protein